MNPYHNHSTNCELIYRDKNTCKGLYKGTFWECCAFVDRWVSTLTDWSIYKVYHKGRKFHNATDERYLEDHDDRYWHNRRFGPFAHVVTMPHPWVFWALMMDEGGMFVRRVEERSSFVDMREFSRAYHDIARRHGFTHFTRDQSLIGGYFVARDGSCIYAVPKSLRPHRELPER